MSTPRVVVQLADLTGLRDRDQLDAALAAALSDLIRPRLVSVHRVVGDEPKQRWLTRAEVDEKGLIGAIDPAAVLLEELPLIDERPAHAQCLRTGQRLMQDGEVVRTVFPLLAESRTSGVLEFQSAAPLAAEQVALIEAILRIFRNFENVLDYGERDTLTGLLNRKTFEQAFHKTVTTTLAPGRPFEHDARRALPGQGQGQIYLGVVDIDHFKRINDTWGHLIGDEVLLLLSRLMRSVFRFQDQLFRFGGEEFVVMLRCAGEIDAATALERLRVAAERYEFPRVGHITLSAGYTQVRDGDAPGGAFARADEALYWAKSSGRNCVGGHEALLAGGLLTHEKPASDVELF